MCVGNNIAQALARGKWQNFCIVLIPLKALVSAVSSQPL